MKRNNDTATNDLARRYNREEGRTGPLWGDRYGSRIVEGAVEEEPDEAVFPLEGRAAAEKERR
jgi:hypothetical protein